MSRRPVVQLFLDPGNGRIKSCYRLGEGKPVPSCVRSVFFQVPTLERYHLADGAGTNDLSPVVDFQGSTYHFGSDVSRYYSPDRAREFLSQDKIRFALLGLLAVAPDLGEPYEIHLGVSHHSPDQRSVENDGLYTNAEYLKRSLEGHHKFVRNGREFDIVVPQEKIGVLHEGIGAINLIAQAEDRDRQLGNQTPERTEAIRAIRGGDGAALVIDIGARTISAFAGFSNGVRVNNFHLALEGMGTINLAQRLLQDTRFLDSVRRILNCPNVPLSAILSGFENDHRFGTRLKWGHLIANEHDPKMGLAYRWADDALSDLAPRLMEVTKFVDAVILVGGGVELLDGCGLLPTVKKMIRDRVLDVPVFSTSDINVSPGIANVLGLQLAVIVNGRRAQGKRKRRAA